MRAAYKIKPSPEAFNAWTSLTGEIGYLMRPTHVKVPGGAVYAEDAKEWLRRAKAARLAFDAAIAMTTKCFAKAPDGTKVHPETATLGLTEFPDFKRP